MKRTEIYKLACQKWGWEAQERMVFEEAGEFITALAKITRTNDPTNLIEEIADLEIMLDQLKMNMGIDVKSIEAIKDKKLERLKQRIDKNKFNG